MSGVVGSDGGFLVPTAVSAGIIDSMLEQSAILPHCRVVGMETPEQRFPTFDNSTSASGVVLGGLSAVWTAEGDSMKPQKPKLRTVVLNARKLAILIPATSELLQDAPGFQSGWNKPCGTPRRGSWIAPLEAEYCGIRIVSQR